MARINAALAMPPLLAAVGAPTVTPQGAGGAETWGYKVVAVDANGKETAASTEGTTAGGNATLDGTNFNRITWTDVTGGVSYKIYRTTSGGTPATLGLIGTVASGVQTFDDTGLVGDASTANATNTTGDGASVKMAQFNGDHTVFMNDIGTGTYQVQVSANNSDWVNEGSALTASGLLNVTTKAMYIRSKCTAFTSGTPTGFVCGDNH
jgi:hypothetical protein